VLFLRLLAALPVRFGRDLLAVPLLRLDPDVVPRSCRDSAEVDHILSISCQAFHENKKRFVFLPVVPFVFVGMVL